MVCMFCSDIGILDFPQNVFKTLIFITIKMCHTEAAIFQPGNRPKKGTGKTKKRAKQKI